MIFEKEACTASVSSGTNSWKLSQAANYPHHSKSRKKYKYGDL
jgi:hypothetical protein